MDFNFLLGEDYEIIDDDRLYVINGGSCTSGGAGSAAPSGGGGSSSTSTPSGGSSVRTSATETTTSKDTSGNNINKGTPQNVTGKPSGAGSDEYNRHKDDAYKDHGSWGRIINKKNRVMTMQQYAKSGEKDENGIEFDKLMNGKTKNKEGKLEPNTFSNQGCKMQGVAKILSEIRGKLFALLGVNDFDKDIDGELSQEEITQGITTNLLRGQKLTTDHFEKTLTKDVLDQITKSKGTTYVLGRAENVHGGWHWVVLEGYQMNSKGQVEFTYNGTSNNDNNFNRKYILGEPLSGQDNYFKISKIETYTINWEN